MFRQSSPGMSLLLLIMLASLIIIARLAHTL